MNVLIELYDCEEPLYNVITAMTMHPDTLVVLGGSDVRNGLFQKRMKNCLRAAGAEPSMRFVECDLYDVARIARQMELLLDEYSPEICTIDVTGGSASLLLAVGLCSAVRDMRVVTYRPEQKSLVYLLGEQGTLQIHSPHLGIRQAIALAGGELLPGGRVDPKDIDAEMLHMIQRIFPVYKQHRTDWPDFVFYLQQVCKSENGIYQRDIRAPLDVYVGKRYAKANLGILSALATVGVVRDMKMNSSECLFRICSEKIARYLCDVGIWLELYLYAVMRQEQLFDDLQINAVVSWDDDTDGDDTLNEIDLIAAAGVKQFFISCKTAIPQNSALHEIATLTARFGNRYAKPVLATMSDLRKEAPAVYRRASEMGMILLDANDLNKNALTARLRAMVNDTTER